jgi:hypothetical protein
MTSRTTITMPLPVCAIIDPVPGYPDPPLDQGAAGPPPSTGGCAARWPGPANARRRWPTCGR